MSQEKLQDLLNYILVSTGTATAGVALNLNIVNEWMALFVKLVSIASFICFLLINQDKIQTGWIRFKNRFKNKK